MGPPKPFAFVIFVMQVQWKCQPIKECKKRRVLTFGPCCANGRGCAPPTSPPFCNTSALLNKSGCARSFVFPYLSKLRSLIILAREIARSDLHSYFANWVGCATRKALLFVMATHCSGAVGFQQLERPRQLSGKKGAVLISKRTPFFGGSTSQGPTWFCMLGILDMLQVRQIPVFAILERLPSSRKAANIAHDSLWPRFSPHFTPRKKNSAPAGLRIAITAMMALTRHAQRISKA